MLPRSHKYKVVVQWNEDKQEFLALAPELGNCIVSAKSEKEAMESVYQAIERHLAELEKNNLPLPTPFSEKKFSGKMLLRISPLLHRELAAEAHALGIPLSHHIERILRNRLSREED